MFNHKNRISNTGLSNKFWKTKDNNRNANIAWESLDRHRLYKTSSNRRLLCLNEKLKIALHRNNNEVNERTKTFKKCSAETSTHLHHMTAKTRAYFPRYASHKVSVSRHLSDSFFPVACQVTGHANFLWKRFFKSIM